MDLVEFIPNALQYGISGLSAIVFLLAYNMLQVQNKKEEPNPAMLKTIKSFMTVALIFSVLSAGSSFTEAYIANSSDDSQRLKDALMRSAANSLSYEVDEIKRRHTYSGGSVAKSGSEIFSGTALSEQMSEDEFNLRMLRLATFNSVSAFDANKEILEGALTLLVSRGYDFSEEQRNSLLSEWACIRRARHKWLREEAIPQAEDGFRSNMMNQSTQLSASIPLPEEVWLLSEYPEGNTPSIQIDFQTLQILKNEIELLKEGGTETCEKP
ncbi:MAG: hypothetical protein Roseis2KO_48750 [Roseivirga sp.]